MRVTRGVSFFVSDVKVMDEHDRVVGGFKQKFFSIGGRFAVLDAQDQPVCTLQGNWTGWDFKFVSGTDGPGPGHQEVGGPGQGALHERRQLHADHRGQRPPRRSPPPAAPGRRDVDRHGAQGVRAAPRRAAAAPGGVETELREVVEHDAGLAARTGRGRAAARRRRRARARREPGRESPPGTSRPGARPERAGRSSSRSGAGRRWALLPARSRSRRDPARPDVRPGGGAGARGTRGRGWPGGADGALPAWSGTRG